MTEPTPAVPPGAASPGSDALGPLTRSVMGRARLARRALSPWIQRMLASAQPEPAAPVQPAGLPRQAAGRSPFAALNRPAPLSSGSALSLVSRVQRTVERGPIMAEQPGPKTGLTVDRFAGKVSARFPDVTRKYQTQPADTGELVQRAALPFAGDSAPSPEPPPTPAVLPQAESDVPELEFPPISVSPEDSVASQLSARLEAYRKLQVPEPSQQPSPRTISRKAEEAAHSQRAKATPPRRSRIEEITPPAGAGPAPRPAIQRKPAEPAAPPPVAQRAPAAFTPGPESEDTGPRPEMPSFSKQLAKRLKDERAKQAAESPEPPAPAPPTVQRAADDSHVAEHREVRRPRPRPRPAHETPAAEPPAIQRSPAPEARPEPAKPIAAPEPPAAQTGDMPLRRKPEPPPAPPEAAPLEAAPSEAALPQPPTAASVAPPTPPADRPLRPSESETPHVRRKTEPPAGTAEPAPTPAAQSKPAPAPTIESPSAPAIQRKADSTPAPAPGPAESSAPTEPPARPAAQTIAPPPAPETPPAARRAAPSIQRSADADMPLHPAPAPPPRTEPGPAAAAPAPRAEAAPATDLPEAARPAAPAAPPAPSIQRQPETAPRPEPGPVAVTPQARPVVARSPEPEPRPEPVTQSEPPRASAPPTEPKAGVSRPLTLARTTTAVLPQARLQREADPQPRPVAAAEREPLALAAPVSAPTASPAVTAARPMAVVQRAMETSARPSPVPVIPPARLPLAPASRVNERVQREETTTPSTTEPAPEVDSKPDETTGDVKPKAAGVDLHDVARRIYPLLKRMLAIEKERRNR